MPTPKKSTVDNERFKGTATVKARNVTLQRGDPQCAGTTFAVVEAGTNYRITENGIPRYTEAGIVRVLE
jgi:hypothetical protein